MYFFGFVLIVINERTIYKGDRKWSIKENLEDEQ